MAADDVGAFHPICGTHIELSQKKRVASCSEKAHGHNFAFSNDPIPIGLQFSVKILKKSFYSVYVSPISAFFRPHTSDAPCTAGGAAHVVHCCLFFVYCDGVEGR